jgi:hypothetical protein
VTSERGYTITLSDLTADLDLYVYSDSNYSSSVCSSTSGGATTDSCQGTAPAGGYFYIKISTYYSSSFTLTVSESPFFTASDTKAEMTAVPTVSSASVAAATTLNVTVPVDDDTGFVRVYIHQTANQTLINGKTPNNYRSVTPGNAQDVTVSVMVPRGLSNGTYQLVVHTAATLSDYSSSDYTVYSETQTGTANVYYKAFVTSSYSPGTFFATNESSKQITVTSAASISATPVTCSTSSSSPTEITLTTAPQAWSSATTVGNGSCYFVLTVPSNTNIYSVSLSGLSSDHELYAYYNGFYTQIGTSETSSNTANEYVSVAPDSYNKIYLKIYNYSAPASSWTLSSH